MLGSRAVNRTDCLHIRVAADTFIVRGPPPHLLRLHSILSNRNINLSARRLLLLSVLRPSIELEYGSEVWKCNKTQTSALESIL